METLRIVIPGLYGYRLDTPRPYDGNKLRSLDGGNYWGSMGQDPVLDRVAEVEEVIAAFGQRNVVPGELAKALNVSVQKATQLMTLVQNKNQFLQRRLGAVFCTAETRKHLLADRTSDDSVLDGARRRVATFGLRPARSVLPTHPSIAVF